MAEKKGMDIMYCPRCDKKTELPCKICNYPGWPNTIIGNALSELDTIIESFKGSTNVILAVARIVKLRDILAEEYEKWRPPVPLNKCIIYGQGFSRTVDEEAIVEECKEIWNNPNKYCEYKQGSDMSYYGFLKFLWVKFPDGTEKQLGDIAMEFKT